MSIASPLEAVSFRKLILWTSWPLIAIPATEYLAVSPIGTDAFLFFQIFIFLAAFGCVFAVPISLFLLVIRSYRKSASRILFVSLVFLIATFVGIKVGKQIRIDAFHRLALRSAALVHAIEAYDQKYGSPPQKLENLVPEFFEKVPETGMKAYPDYRYFSGKEAEIYEGNPWALTIFTPSGGINFDQFVYFPKQNYPEFGYGGWLRRIHDWAYVHE
jgi:hypothetical protein